MKFSEDPRLDAEEREVVARHEEAVAKFRDFCDTKAGGGNRLTVEERDYLGNDPFEESDFHDLSLGFFIALGVPLNDSFDLARITRYDFQYWQ